MKRLFTTFCGLAFLGTLVACGSPTSDVSFKPPNGYVSKMNLFGTEMWAKGAQDDQSAILLMRLPVKMDPDKFNPESVANTTSTKNAKVESSKRTTICGNQPAIEMKMTATKSQGDTSKQMDMDMVVTGIGGNTFMAMYMHPQGEAVDPDAEAAIENVCAKK